MADNFISLFSMIKQDREFYREILKFNKSKVRLFDKGKSATSLINTQIAICDRLIVDKAQESGRIQLMFEK